MSSVTAAARTRTDRLRVAVSADALALAGVVGLAALLVALTWGTWGDLNNDTGHDFVAGIRFAHGELPYVDYIYYYGPLAPALLGLAVWLGGAGIGVFIGFGLAVAAAIVLATYALARMRVGPLGAFLAAAVTLPVAFAPHQFTYVLPHTSAATLGTLSLLCFLLALGRFVRGAGPGWLAAAGLSCGLATLTKPEFAFAALGAAVAWLVLRTLGGERRPRDWGLLLGPAVLVPAAVYGAFLTAVPPHRLVYENLDPRDFLDAAGNTILRARTPLTVTSFAHLGAKLVLYAAGIAALIIAARLLSRRRSHRPASVLLALAALAAGAGSVTDPEALRHGLKFAYGWIPAGAAVGVLLLLLSYRRRRGEWSPGAQADLAGLVALTVLAATNYASFYAYAWNAQLATYAIPLAATFLVRLHLVELARVPNARALGAAWLAFLAAAGLGLTLKDARAESVAVRGPGGTLKESPALASAYQAAVDWITKSTRPGERILLAPQLTWLYALSERTDPLPDISLLPGTLAGPGKEQAAIARLQADGVRLAVIDRHGFPGFGHTFFGGSFDRQLDRWIRGHFVRVATYPTGSDIEAPRLEIWLRRGA